MTPPSAPAPRSGTTAGLVEQIADEIQARVVGGDIPIGTWLRQDRLAEEFQISRTPIREALQTLRARGVIELIPHRGARVRLPTLREIQESYFLRSQLEGLAAELAADLMSQIQLDRLREAERLFEQAVRAFADPSATDRDKTGSQRSWIAANDLFHEVLQEASCNRLLHDTIANLHRSFPRNLTWGVLDDVRLLEANVAQHRLIREAIEERDGATARARMIEHIQRSGELIVSRGPLGRDDGAGAGGR